MQARELVTPDMGALIGFGESNGIATEVTRLFRDPEGLRAMSETAFFKTRAMIWPNVALRYMQEFQKLAPALVDVPRRLPPIRIEHIRHLTDDFGMLQFTHLNVPETAW